MTSKETDALEYIAHMARFGWFATSCRLFRRSTFRSLVDAGLVSRHEGVVMVDGDGWTIQPERHRTGYTFTDAGRAEWARIEKERAEALPQDPYTPQEEWIDARGFAGQAPPCVIARPDDAAYHAGPWPSEPASLEGA